MCVDMIRYRLYQNNFIEGDDGLSKDDMIIMENLIPKGFEFISHGDISSNKVELVDNKK